jgi:S-adenosylmethionine:tRNA ribosyltransferase-isomerase
LDTILGQTEIFIFPGYTFRMIEGLITNFHQPGSTLVLLIATILGEDWKRVYGEALAKDYRFLSYGDSSLLWIKF